MSSKDQFRLPVTNIQQEKTIEPDGNGNFAAVWTITFTTPSGIKTWVKVPAIDYSPDNVAAAIETELMQVEAVQSLQQP